MTAAIPTRYGGVNFRSRLEARWAAMFDLLEWPWEYEPLDLDGYIPDFIVCPPRDPPTLVEVKPIIHWPCLVPWCAGDCNPVDATHRGIHDEALARLESSGWSGPSLLVGATLMTAGRLRVPRVARVGKQFDADDAEVSYDRVLAHCRRCPRVFLMQDIAWCEPSGEQWDGYNLQRWCDCDDSDRAAYPFDPTPLWREAGNQVQWRKELVR